MEVNRQENSTNLQDVVFEIQRAMQRFGGGLSVTASKFRQGTGCLLTGLKSRCTFASGHRNHEQTPNGTAGNGKDAFVAFLQRVERRPFGVSQDRIHFVPVR
jgi:hypothetical protein